eukprot:CAMPEP_0196722362 /NCGR_PEP_ID=MMETSP1091-20130531/4739_1 /TAXON_ID=302021 /ORGANISM="Rhodomonas sp., Strain CCMP768" /LENGTH=132 /DNA_ID=CAMNT_0042064043 /DNA_START=15 /DNA_END=413 /DNA_ORIENTATION=+
MTTISDDGTDKEVSATDQADINAFSRLNVRYHDIEDDLKLKKEELVNLQDCSNELLMILDDEELVKVGVGESYADLNQEEAQEHVNALVEEAEKSVSGLEAEMTNVKDKMKELKARLKVKFGNSINLDEDEA